MIAVAHGQTSTRQSQTLGHLLYLITPEIYPRTLVPQHLSTETF